MKKVLMAAVAALSIGAGAVYADGLSPTPITVVPEQVNNSVLGPDASFVGSAVYAVEAETFELNFGTEFVVNDWTITPYLTATHDQVNDLEFEGLTILTEYSVNQNFNLFASIASDEHLEYKEFTVGTGFRF